MSENEKKDDFLEEDFNEDFGELKGDSSQKRKRMMMLLLVLILAGGAFFYLTSEDEGIDPFAMNQENVIAPKRVSKGDMKVAKKDDDDEEKKKRRGKKRRGKKEKEEKTEEAKSEELAKKTAMEKRAAFGPISLVSPSNGASRNYDLTSDRPVFAWNGEAERIVFSRNANMKPAHFSSAASGQKHTGKHLEPGTWYWQVRNSDGGSDVFSFVINSSDEVSPVITEPAAGSSLSQEGSVVRWSQLDKAAYYRVQLTEKDTWLQPAYMFATSGSELTLNGVAPGSYKMRVGGFSESSGRWEYSDSIDVDVQ